MIHNLKPYSLNTSLCFILCFVFLTCSESFCSSFGTPPGPGGGPAGPGGGMPGGGVPGKGKPKGGADASTKTGKVTYSVHWARSLDQSIRYSQEDKTPILVYFEPSSLGKKKKKYKLFETKSFSEASSQYSFVKISSSKKTPLREDWKISKNKHTFHICDWHGNSLKFYSSKGSVKAKTLIKDLKNINQLMKKVIAKHEKSLKKAQSSFSKEDYLKTLKHLDKILAYKGYDVVDKANDLVFKVTDAVKTQIDDINSLSDTAAKKSQLDKLLKDYEDYPQITKMIEKEMNTLRIN